MEIFNNIWGWIVWFFSGGCIDLIVGFYTDYIAKVVDTFMAFADFGKMDSYQITKTIKDAWNYIIAFLLIYKTIYIIVGFFKTRKFKPATKQYKYAILVAARNESPVIGNLIDSIKKQDYPSDLITTFVVADNCTDNTAEIARQYGAICYERFDENHKTKGFALQFLLDRIEEDYGRQSFDGYFIFDADNLLKRDFVTRMNESFDAGEKIVCSYRNTKNFDDNWISASYAIHWLRSIRLSHRARSFFRLATNIQGTGFLFASELVKDGWKYTSLTEDRAFTCDAVAMGYPISYNNDAEFYDEQPVNLRIALRQRIRWAKGHILAFLESGWQVFKNMFVAKGFRNRFMSYDIFFLMAPRTLFGMARNLIVWGCYTYVYIEKGFISCLLTVLGWRLTWRISDYFVRIFEAVYVFIMERKRIKKIKWYKKLWFSLMWPWFDIIGAVSMYIALFKKVTWKPIPHESQVNIDDTEKHISGE